MGPKPFFLLKPFVYLGVFLLGWWCLPTAFKSFTKATFYELQAPAWISISHLKDLQQYWSLRNHTKKDLIEAGRDLARLNAAYELSSQENSALRHEIKNLEELLDLPTLPDFSYEIARVARRDQNTWWQHLTLRKGKNYNIPKGAGVIFAGGVVGRVKEVHSHTCIVELVSSPSFRIAGHFENDFRPVTFQGNGNGLLSKPSGQVREVPLDIPATPDQPQRVISSHLGGAFPTGLTIGWVDKLDAAPDGLFAQGNVYVDPRLNALQEVAILIPKNIPAGNKHD